MTDNPYRLLPAVDTLADQIDSDLPHPVLVEVARQAIEQARHEIEEGGSPDTTATARRLASEVETRRGVRIVNASGVLLHTNIGRAAWSERAARRAVDAATGFENLELEVATGERSRRGSYVSRLLTELTGAEAGLVVNNNASALLLVLAAVAAGRSVPVSRGELIEIGGSYRLPDVMEASGTNLVEVGTSNRTRADDYRTALQLYECGALLKIHPSNYRIEGFTEEASLEQLAPLAAEAGVPLLYDLGSGLLDSSQPWVPSWLGAEPGVRQSLGAGADLVMFSGDKLLGGPQAGIIVGRSELVQSVRAHPLARALRVDGVVYAALASTLESYLDGKPQEIPFWRHALTETRVLEDRCDELAQSIGGTVEVGESQVGAGSAPGAAIPTPVIRLAGMDDLFTELLRHRPAVLTRRDRGDLLIDLRAVEPDQDRSIVEALEACRS